jgi:hypothetical protein
MAQVIAPLHSLLTLPSGGGFPGGFFMPMRPFTLFRVTVWK